MSRRRHLQRQLMEVYHGLLSHYGPQHWWPGDSPFEVIVGAILTQSAAWGNVEKAINNLKAAGVWSPAALLETAEEELARLVYPAGYFNAKARKLKAFAVTLFERFGGDLQRLLATPWPELRPVLLRTHGIGPETADSIILYACGQPVFVVDAYTRRIMPRLGLQPEHDDYTSWQALFMDNLPSEVPLYNEYHALLVAHGKALCRKEPLCMTCPVLSTCPTGKACLGEGQNARDPSLRSG